MKKKMLLAITFCIGLMLLCACQSKPQNVSSYSSSASANTPTTGALTMPDYTSKVDGLFARFDNGVEMILVPGGDPIILQGDMDLSILNSGDSISIYCNAIFESYPAQTTVVECELHERGSLQDLPAEQMEAVKELGYEIKEFEVKTQQGGF